RGAARAAVARDRAQPLLGALNKNLGREEHEGHAPDVPRDEVPDEAHVVEEGSHASATSPSRKAAPLPIALTLARSARCERTTPFGVPVLPDVYWMRAGESGSGGVT